MLGSIWFKKKRQFGILISFITTSDEINSIGTRPPHPIIYINYYNFLGKPTFAVFIKTRAAGYGALISIIIIKNACQQALLGRAEPLYILTDYLSTIRCKVSPLLHVDVPNGLFPRVFGMRSFLIPMYVTCLSHISSAPIRSTI
jgi:hypothetical protein